MYVCPSSFWTIPATFGGLEKVKSATHKVNSVAHLTKSVADKVNSVAHLTKSVTEKVKSVAHLTKSTTDKVKSIALLTKSAPPKGKCARHLVSSTIEQVTSTPVKPLGETQKPAFGTTAAEIIMAMTEIVNKLTRRIL